MIFCSQCGNQAQGRFCSQCGTALASDAPQAASSSPNGPGNSTAPPPPYQFEPPQESFSPQHQPSRASFTPQYQAPPEPLTALIGSQGQRMPAFFHIASELFIALDQAIAPKGTRGLEANKIAEFRKMGGKSIPQYYESHVLPVYYNNIGAECVPNMPKANILTWDGWHTFLHHKIIAAPNDTYTHLLAALRILNVQLPHPLLRGDLPLHPYPEAVAREQNFQQEIRGLAQMAMQVRSAQVNAMASLMKQGAENIRMAAAPAGSYYYR